jgi:thymidylate synthase (FAD)
MRIIEPSFEIVDPVDRAAGVRLLQKIEKMARISHRSEDKQTEDSYEKFIRAVVIGHGDWSVVEHASATVIFRVDRGITHELVRHRLFSFTQESTRFVNGRKSYPDGLEFIQPSFVGADPVVAQASWKADMYHAEQSYFDQLDMGQPPQIARSILPNALASTISVTGNLRNWRHFFLMRSSKESHPDMRKVVIPLLAEFQKLVPIIYDDVVSNARQIENLRMPR